jgi:hypothetical protein
MSRIGSRVASLACALLALGLLAANASADWNVHESKEGRFIASFPATPTRASNKVETKLGPLEYWMFEAALGPSASFAISYVDYPADTVRRSNPSFLLDGARDGSIRAIKGTLVSEKEILLGIHPGREVKASMGGSATYNCKLFLVGNRLYQVLAVTMNDSYLQETRRFLDSFALQ